MMYGKSMFAIAAVCAVSQAMTATAYGATSTLNMKRRAIDLLGIMNTKDLNAAVTRAGFARMLVRSTDYRNTEAVTSKVSVYADVLNTSEYASAIRIAAENGWMSGFLGGNFRPEQGVTMREAAKSLLALLGYSDSDFAGNISENRMAKFAELGLNSNIQKDDNEVLTKADCVFLFYNLMTAKTKSGMQYGSQVFNLKFDSDGEINLASIQDDSLVGPKLINYNDHDLDDVVPFSLKNATLFLNGHSSDEDTINSEAILVYYHRNTKTVFAYSGEDETMGVTIGEIKSIYYDSTDLFTPVSVILDTYDQEFAEDGDEFLLSGSDFQYQFSIYGTYEAGDQVVIIWQKNGNGENETYSLLDVYEEDDIDN